METRNPGDNREHGMGEVHSHLSQPGSGAGLGGATAGSTGSSFGQGAGTQPHDQAGQLGAEARDRAGTMVNDAREQAHETMDQVRSKAEELRGKAEETLGQARTRASEAIDRAESELEERTGVISMIRENPLPSLGIAVAAGYLIAGSRSRKRGRVMNMATSQLRGAIMAGVSAALAREFRSIMDEQGGSLASLFGGGDKEESRKPASSGMTGTSYDATTRNSF
jgi:ElaB/YqjD/DUF883 family membrane-anchored ribosome-binding protein